MNNLKKIAPASVILLTLIGCKVTQDYARPNLLPDYAGLYGAEAKKDSATMAKLDWHQVFPDPKLQAVINQTLANNFDIKIAIERINEADAAFRQSQLANLPTVDASLGPKTIKNSAAQSLNTSNINTLQLGITSNWEIDVWGKIAAAKRASYAALLQSSASKRAVQTQLAAQAANYYFQLLALDKQVEITKQTIKIREKDLETVKALMEADYLTGVDIAQSEALLYAARVSLPDLEINIRAVENSLNILMGKVPGRIERSTLDTQVLTKNFDEGVPLQLLSYRPDVEAAELGFRNAFENLNIAKANIYPSINIAAGVGLLGNFSNLFTNTLYYSLGGAANQAIFEQGGRRAQVKIMTARQQEALYNFQKTLLTAGSEVSTQLYTYQKSLEKDKNRSLQISSLERAADFSKELLKFSSKANYTNVLTAEQSLLSAQLSAVNDKLQQLQSMTAFYRAVGGFYQAK